MSDMQTLGELVSATFRNVRASDVEEAGQTLGAWHKTLCSIRTAQNPNEGNRMADHSRVVDVQNGTLLVEVDHPGWTGMIQMHKKYILEGLRREVPQLGIRNLAFRLSGTEFTLNGGRGENAAEDARKRMEKRLEAEERSLRGVAEFSGRTGDQAESDVLSPELSRLFEDLRKNMLTKKDD